VTINGETNQELLDALQEVMANVTQGFTSGRESTDGGDYLFQVSGELRTIRIGHNSLEIIDIKHMIGKELNDWLYYDRVAELMHAFDSAEVKPQTENEFVAFARVWLAQN